MKTTKPLIIIYVLLASFLVGRIALADDSGIFDSVSSESALEAPRLTVTIEGTKVTLSWSSVFSADYYVLHYAQYTYDNPESIKTIDMGDKTTFSVDLVPGNAYHVAVKACDASGFYCSYYSNIQDVIIPIPTTFGNSLGQVFALLPAGTFTMGSPSGELGRKSDETQHQVTLTKSFYMQTTEVTQAQWKAVMGSNPSYFSGCDSCPVENVSWDTVQSYITKINLREEGTYSLATEAQWEYSARAGSTTAFYNGHITKPQGDDPNLDKIGWYEKNTNLEGPKPWTHPVGQKKPNAWGLYDMSGNVWELVKDRYGDYPSGAVTDPTGPGPSAGSYRVVRGGGWGAYARSCRSANRETEDAFSRNAAVGFRLVRAQ
mgnify:FL=1